MCALFVDAGLQEGVTDTGIEHLANKGCGKNLTSLCLASEYFLSTVVGGLAGSLVERFHTCWLWENAAFQCRVGGQCDRRGPA